MMSQPVGVEVQPSVTQSAFFKDQGYGLGAAGNLRLEQLGQADLRHSTDRSVPLHQQLLAFLLFQDVKPSDPLIRIRGNGFQ